MAFKAKWHNLTTTKTYWAWRSMRSRCYNPQNPSYQHYGARGIEVCPEWKDDFDQFVKDMGQPTNGMSLDRIDNNAHYSPTNCRWATVTEQLNNQRRNHRITHNGKTQTLSQWARSLGLKTDALARRLNRMPVERALQAGKLIEWKHGTRHGYDAHKCRCEECKNAHNARMRKLRAKRKSKNENATERLRSRIPGYEVTFADSEA